MAITQQDIMYFVLTDRFYGKNKSVSEKGLDKNRPGAYHGGNFDGIIEKIPYLKNLGITALWITPVYVQVDVNPDWAQAYHGYWALDFNKVDPHLYSEKGYEPGSRKYLKDLVDTLHSEGIKVILDIVVNHTGYNHPGQSGSNDNPTPIKPEWFNERGLSSDADVIEGELAGLPDFNLDHPDAIDYHINSIISWITETGIDALRMDTAKHVERGFWNYFKTQVQGKYPQITLIGEALVFNIDELTDFQKFWGFDSLFDFPVQQTINRVFLENFGFTEFESPFRNGSGIFERDTAYSNQNRMVSLLDNHDLSFRFMTGALRSCNGDKDKAVQLMKLALTFQFTTRGIPQLYYGTEVGLEGGGDPDNRRDFPWHMIDEKNNVSGKYGHEKEIFNHTKKLINIRKNNPALHAGTHVCLYVDYFVYAYLNWFSDNVVITLLHNGWGDMKWPLKIDLNNFSILPTRVKKIIENKTFNCGLTGNKIEIKNGSFEFMLKAKGSMILI